MKIKHSLIAATILTTASFSSYASTTYNITNLGTVHQGDRSAAYGISDTAGLITGYARGRVPTGIGEDTRTSTRAARFFHETDFVQDIGGLGYSGHGSAIGIAVNDSGLVAGYGPATSSTGTRVYKAFVHHNKSGFMQNIGTLGDGKESRAYGINNNGKVVGWSNTLADGSDNKAFLYDSSTNSMSELQGPLLGGSRSFAFDINDTDQVVGTATTENGSANAFIYENGVATNLGSLGDSGYSEARAINASGAVTGFSLDENNIYSVFHYNDAAGMTALTGLGGDAWGYDINADGIVVGTAKDADGGNHAVVSIGDELIDLLLLLPTEEQDLWKELRTANSISDDGTIVGYGSYWTDKDAGRSKRMAFMLTTAVAPEPVPLPGAIFLMGPALGFLGFMRKRNSHTVA